MTNFPKVLSGKAGIEAQAAELTHSKPPFSLSSFLTSRLSDILAILCFLRLKTLLLEFYDIVLLVLYFCNCSSTVLNSSFSFQFLNVGVFQGTLPGSFFFLSVFSS